MVKIGKEKKERKEQERKQRQVNIEEWLQRLQQRIESIEKRLDAVERRLSNETFTGAKFAGAVEEEKNFSAKLREVAENFKKEIESLKRDIEAVQKHRVPLNVSGENVEKPVTISIKRGPDYSKELASIERRLEKLEKSRKNIPTVKVGKIEVPIEITGIIGGLLAFLIAALLFAGYKNLVVSPPFVMFIGVVLMVATALKTYFINISKR